MSKNYTQTKETIKVSDLLPIKQNGRAAGFNLKSSIAEIIDNSIDANNSAIMITINTVNGITQIYNGENGLSKEELSNLVSVGTSGSYDDGHIGNYGLGAFHAITYLGENGEVEIETIKSNQKAIAKLDFKKSNPTPMNYNLKIIENKDIDSLRITCKTNSFDIFDNVNSLANDLGAHYHDILKSEDFKIFLGIDGPHKEIKPIDPFYKDSKLTVKWPESSIHKLPIIDNSEVEVDFQGYYISRNTDKNELDKKGKKGFPHEYQGIYINLNGRILKLGNGWGIDGINNKWVGGRMEIKVKTKSLPQKDKVRILEFFGITSNKNNPNLEISEKSIDKKELRKIIKEFRSWTDKQYDEFNNQRKNALSNTSVVMVETKKIDLSQLKITNLKLENVKQKGILEAMFPDILEAIEEYQNHISLK